MSLGQVNWNDKQPSSPAELKQWFHTDVVQPAESKKTMLYKLAKKVEIEGESFVVPARSRGDMTPDMLRAGENSPFPLERISYSGRRGVAELHGVAVNMTETAIDRNKGLFNIKQDHIDYLQTRLAVELEKLCVAALKEVNLAFVPTGMAEHVVETSGTITDTATQNLNIYHMENLSLLLRDTYAVEKYPGMNSHIGFTRGVTAYSIGQDSRYDARYEGVPEELKGSVLKDIRGIKLMEVNDDDILADNLGSSTNVSETFIVGKDALFAGLVSPLSLNLDFNQLFVNNLGGTQKYAWIKGDLKIMAPRIAATKYEVSSIYVGSA